MIPAYCTRAHEADPPDPHPLPRRAHRHGADPRYKTLPRDHTSDIVPILKHIAASFQFTIGVIPAPQELAKRIADQGIPKGLEDSAPARTSPTSKNKKITLNPRSKTHLFPFCCARRVPAAHRRTSI